MHGGQDEDMQQYLQRMERVLAQTEEMHQHVAASQRGRQPALSRRLNFSEGAAALPGPEALREPPGTAAEPAAAQAGADVAAEILDSGATLSEWIRSATQSSSDGSASVELACGLVPRDGHQLGSPALPASTAAGGSSSSIFEWGAAGQQQPHLGVPGIVRALSCGSPRDASSLPPTPAARAEVPATPRQGCSADMAAAAGSSMPALGSGVRGRRHQGSAALEKLKGRARSRQMHSLSAARAPLPDVPSSSAGCMPAAQRGAQEAALGVRPPPTATADAAAAACSSSSSSSCVSERLSSSPAHSGAPSEEEFLDARESIGESRDCADAAQRKGLLISPPSVKPRRPATAPGSSPGAKGAAAAGCGREQGKAATPVRYLSRSFLQVQCMAALCGPEQQSAVYVHMLQGPTGAR